MREADRWFSFLLRLLPRSFRMRHGAELGPLLERMKDELGSSPTRVALLRLYLAVTWDLLRQFPWSARELAPVAGREALRPRSTGWRDALAADARFAFRQFGKRWGTTLTMLALLSLGMAISIVLFSYVHSYAVLPPAGMDRVEDLVRIRGSQADGYGGRGVRTFSYEELEGYRRLTEQFSAVAGWAYAAVNVDIAGGEGPDSQELGDAIFVTEGYFPVLGVRPILGPGLPTLEAEDPTVARVAVIGHEAWAHLLGRSPDVIGRTLDVNGVPITVVGVAPPRFLGIGGGSRVQLWLPLASRFEVLPGVSTGDLAFRAVARLSPGVSESVATAAVQGVSALAAEPAESLERAGTEEDLDPSAEVVPLLGANGDPNHERDVGLLILSLGLLAVLVLMVTCTNVSALLTGLAMARRQEIAVRLSLGAPRTRIVRQLLTESALLALIAGAGALGAVGAVLRVIETKAPLLPFQIGIT